MVHLFPELLVQIAKYCDLITCISLASCNKIVRKEITSLSGLKMINTLKYFPEVESWQEFILKHSLEIMNDKCYLYHPCADCFEYALSHDNEELIDLLKSLLNESGTELQNIMNHAIKYKNYNLIDCLIFCNRELDIHPECDLTVLKYLMERHEFKPKKNHFVPKTEDTFLYLYEKKLHFVENWSKDLPKICYQNVKVFNRLCDDGIIRKDILKHLVRLLEIGTLECLTLFIKNYSSEYKSYLAKNAIFDSLHNHELFKFLIEDNNINLLTVSQEEIRNFFDCALEIATLETITYLYQYLTHTIESLSNDLIFALDHRRIHVCDFLLNKINQLPQKEINLWSHISSTEYWPDLCLNMMPWQCLLWLENNIDGSSIPWRKVLLYNDSVYDTNNHMALVYFVLEYLHKHGIRINKKCKFLEEHRRCYIYRHHIKLYERICDFYEH
jgi:hypothetical protein